MQHPMARPTQHANSSLSSCITARAGSLLYLHAVILHGQHALDVLIAREPLLPLTSLAPSTFPCKRLQYGAAPQAPGPAQPG